MAKGYYTDILGPTQGKPPPKPKKLPPTTWDWTCLGGTNTWFSTYTPCGISYNSGVGVQYPCSAAGGVFGRSFLNDASPLPCNQNFSVTFQVTTDMNGSGSPDPPGTNPPHPWASANPNQVHVTTPLVPASAGIYNITTSGVTSLEEQSVSFIGLYSNYYVMNILSCECDNTIGTPPGPSGYGIAPEYAEGLIAGVTLTTCCTPVASATMNSMPYGFKERWAHDPALAGPGGTMEYTNNPIDPNPGSGTYNQQVAPINIPLQFVPQMRNLTAHQDFPNQATLCELCADWVQGGGAPGQFGAGSMYFPNWGISVADAEEACGCCSDIMANPPLFVNWDIPPVAYWCPNSNPSC